MKRRLSRLNIVRMRESIVDAGELPYRSSREALREFAVAEDSVAGLAAVDEMLNGIDPWVDALEEFADAFGQVAVKAVDALRGPGDEVVDEELGG